MGRKRLKGFVEMKMLASRVEASDYYQFEAVIKKDGKKLQEVMNQFVRCMISGTLAMSGSAFSVQENSQ